jgi:glycosyltransferase involved in cell wall biosynthesis
MKVAIVHEWLLGMTGSEKVVEALCELFPQATLFCLIYNKKNLSETINKMKIKPSFVQYLPFAMTKYRYYLPLFPYAIEQFDLRDYDLVISSNHCVAKGVITKPKTLHICYCHTPMRYGWEFYFEYFGNSKLNSIISFFMNYIRIWDVVSSNRVDYFIANSRAVAARINKHYRREATLIYPPIDTSIYRPDSKDENFFLIVSRLVPYKRIDIAIKAFNELKLPLIIIGDGPELKKLKKMANSNIEFKGKQDTKIISKFYAQCKALVFPGEEDFGMVPIEAQAAGRPVIAYKAGGALETIIDGITGIFFEEQTHESLIQAIRKFETIKFDKEKIRTHALKFDKAIFKEKMKEFIASKIKERSICKCCW